MPAAFAEIEKASEEVYTQVTSSPVGFAGAQGLKEKNPNIKIYADNYVKNIVNGVAGGNEKDVHVVHVTPQRDIKVDVYADLKYGKKLYVRLIFCDERDMNYYEKKFIAKYNATESYNNTKGGGTYR